MLILAAGFFALLSLSVLNSEGLSANRWSLRPTAWWMEESRSGLGPELTKLTQWQLRQRFLLDLLLQVHKPLLQQELIEMGRQLNDNPSDYEASSWPLLLDFMDRVKQGRILRPNSIYSQLQEELPQQLLGVYRFLLLAKDWRTFQGNACYARSRFHPVLFVNALQLAIEDRWDTQDVRMPAMHEVLPQLYFGREIIQAAQQVNWQQLARISYKHSWKSILGNIWKPKIFWEPEDVPTEPLVIEVNPLKMELYLDVSLSNYWSHLISRLLIADGILSPDEERLFLHNIRQFVALYQLDELATGKRSWQLLESSLLTTGGVPYKATTLQVEAVRDLITASVDQLSTNIKKGQPVGQVITREYWQLCRQLSSAINGNGIKPNLLGMATSNLRDPIYRELLQQLAKLIEEHDHLSEAPMETLHIKATQLETFEELLDTDLINLMDHQLLQTQRNNLKLLQRRLVARQLRLNHKHFSISYQLSVHTPIVASIRSYLLPVDRQEPRLLLDSFVSYLAAGKHRLERHFPTAPNSPTLSELYEAKLPFEGTPSEYSFPQHLLLPRGTADGLKFQLLVELQPWHSNENGTAPLLARGLLDVIIKHQEVGIPKD